MSLEVTAASLEEVLLDELQFSLKKGANYVTRRESVTMYPSGSGGYSYNAIKVIRIPLMASAGQWLDPTTLSLSYDLKSNAPADVTTGASQNRNRIKLNSGQHNIFSRLRILVGGQTLEDIGGGGAGYNRLYDMYLKLAPESYLKNYTVQGPGILEPFPSQRFQYFDCREFAPGSVTTMSMPLICGLFSSNTRWLPLRWLNPIIELELCDPTIAVRLPGHVTGPSGNTVTYSGDFAVENVRITADICTLDDSLEQEFSKVLLSGRKMPLSLTTMNTTMHSLVPGDDAPTITSNRSVSRLKTAFLSFYASRPADGQGSEVNLFHHPLGASGDSSHPATVAASSDGTAVPNNQNYTLQFLVNSIVYPVMPIRNSKEMWTQLTKSLGQHNSTQHPLGISWLEYITTQHIVGMDFETVVSLGYTGINLRNNSNLSVQLSNLTLNGTLDANDAKTLRRAYITQVFDVVVEISDSGVLIMD